MRISDWSSDVCSSDLGPDRTRPSRWAARRWGARKRGTGKFSTILQYKDAAPSARARSSGRWTADGRGAGDRKSVVEGKSVSVRVELGCRRVIQKKTEENLGDRSNKDTIKIRTD